MVVNCEDVWREISNYLDGELDAATKQAFELHFEECRKCKAIATGTRNIVQVFGDEQLIQLPAGFHTRMHRGLVAEVEGRRTAKSVWMATAVASGLLAATALMAVQIDRRGETLRAPMSQPARRVPQKLVAISEDGKTFHTAACPLLHGKRVMLPAEEAIKRGYSPCTHCMKEALKAARQLGKADSGEEFAMNWERETN